MATRQSDGRGDRAEGREQMASLLFALCSLLFAGITAVRPTRRRSAARRQAPIRRLAIADAIAEGEKLYNETCTSCHGKDGTGGELGPPVAAQNRRYLRRTDRKSSTRSRTASRARRCRRSRDSSPTIRSGASPRTSAVFAARRSTRRPRATSPAARRSSGARANCGSCHMVKAKGGILGPDLSNLGGTRKVQNIVDALTKENHKIAADGGTHDATLVPMTTYQPVRITMADGKVVSGILKNEDSFSLQVLGKDDLNLYRFKRAGREGVLRPAEPDAARLGQAPDAGGVSGSDGVSDAAVRAAAPAPPARGAGWGDESSKIESRK